MKSTLNSKQEGEGRKKLIKLAKRKTGVAKSEFDPNGSYSYSEWFTLIRHLLKAGVKIHKRGVKKFSRWYIK